MLKALLPTSGQAEPGQVANAREYDGQQGEDKELLVVDTEQLVLLRFLNVALPCV